MNQDKLIGSVNIFWGFNGKTTHPTFGDRWIYWNGHGPVCKVERLIQRLDVGPDEWLRIVESGIQKMENHIDELLEERQKVR